ncbi:MAG: hypothetical protein JNK50_15640 [Bacteroidia bacterium]|nr:hypothetical protein [Bacteroidia bacterium]
MTDKVTIELTKDEALVLFDFLGRFNQVDHKNIFEDQAEQKALWVVEGQLEKTLVEPFMPNYIELIKESRDKIRDEE